MKWVYNLCRFVCNEGNAWKAISKRAMLFNNRMPRESHHRDQLIEFCKHLKKLPVLKNQVLKIYRGSLFLSPCPPKTAYSLYPMLMHPALTHALGSLGPR